MTVYLDIVSMLTMPSIKQVKNSQQLFAEYIEECEIARGLRPETIKSYKAVAKHFFTIMPEVLTVKLLTREVMVEFFKRIQKRERIVGRDTKKVGLADSTIHTYGNKLNAFLVWLVQKKLIEENPLENIKLKYPEYNDQRALKSDEVHKIISAISLHPVNALILKRDMVMAYILLFCGLRKGEFISLQGRDIDMDKKTITVRAETSKSKRSRVIPIHPILFLALEEYIKERNKREYKTEYLIVSSSEDKGLSTHGLKHWIKRLIKISGVKFHLHRFRHTFACNLAKQNISILKIRDLMGHKSIKMTEVYLRSIITEDLRDDINKLDI